MTSLSLLVLVLALGDPPPVSLKPERDPQEVFQKASARLVALEANHALLKGVSKVKPTIERDSKQRWTSASLVFANNAVPPGKEPARAKNAAQPFLHVSVQVWAGRTQQPPADLHEFTWKGSLYQMWVRVVGSDPALVKKIRAEAEGPLLEPLAPAK